MRFLALTLLLLLQRPLPAAEGTARWEEVLLLDWVYPGEPAYEALRSAVQEAGATDWVAQRLGRGEKIPQASARELAWRFQDDFRVGPATKQKLKLFLSDESELLKETGEKNYAQKADKIAAEFDALSKKMDEIDEIFKMNTYGKGNIPSSTLTVFAGHAMTSTYGMISGKTEGALLGGVGFSLAGTLDKANYTFSLSGDLNNNDFDAPYATRRGGVGVGFSFVLPMGDNGLEFNLGNVSPVNLSHLLMSAIAPAGRDIFSVDFQANYRGVREIKELDLGYPSTGWEQKGLLLRRQGASTWWPFTSTQLTYAPDIQYWETWNPKFNIFGLRLDEELGPRGDLFDNIILYGVLTNLSTDEDEIRPAVVSPKPVPQESMGYAGGVKMQLSTGSSLNAEYAVSSYRYKPEQTSLDKAFGYDDSAVIATASQPIGPFNLAFEGGMAGPRFINMPVAANHLQAGATLDSTWEVPATWYTGPYRPIGQRQQWLTMMREPTVLSNNTTRAVAKLQWAGSWLSFGLYEGVVSQINPSGPFVITSPYIQNRSFNGFGWFRIFGQTYAPPVVATLPDPGPGIDPSIQFQWRYNNPTMGPATLPSTGVTANINWHELAQISYRETQVTIALSEKGVKDQRLMPDSVKSLNYMGGTAKLDFRSLFTRQYPFDVILTGEIRDLAPQAGIPAMDDSNYFNQQITTGYLVFGLTDKIDLLGMGGYETWRTKQSFFPLFVQVRELGIGADFNLDPYLTGLKLNVRSSWVNHEDLFRAQRDFSFWTFGFGTFLQY